MTLAYEWAVFPYPEATDDSATVYEGITDRPERAIEHVENLLRKHGGKVAGKIYASFLVVSGNDGLSYGWEPVERGRAQFCTITSPGKCRWCDVTIPVQRSALRADA